MEISYSKEPYLHHHAGCPVQENLLKATTSTRSYCDFLSQQTDPARQLHFLFSCFCGRINQFHKYLPKINLATSPSHLQPNPVLAQQLARTHEKGNLPITAKLSSHTVHYLAVPQPRRAHRAHSRLPTMAQIFNPADINE